MPETTMSSAASAVARKASEYQSIPTTRRVLISDENDMPSDYGTTPGGTMFAHTPGGTRIVYERRFLMQMKDSPLAKSPPANLPVIPGVTTPRSPDKMHKINQHSSSFNSVKKLQSVTEEIAKDEEQFPIDI